MTVAAGWDGNALRTVLAEMSPRLPGPQQQLCAQVRHSAWMSTDLYSNSAWMSTDFYSRWSNQQAN